jgi:hypothetical protein
MIWAKYKACRARELHTGGGDSDRDTEAAENVGKKRVKKDKRAEFSDEVLNEFEQSAIYQMIDAV